LNPGVAMRRGSFFLASYSCLGKIVALRDLSFDGEVLGVAGGWCLREVVRNWKWPKRP
jgi:hypothetical protein